MILIILPVHNESKTIEKTVFDLNEWCASELQEEYKIFFVDDGSTDDTFKKLQAFNGKIKSIQNKFDQGKGSALKVGYIYTTLIFNAPIESKVFFMDGDGQIDPKEIKTFLNLMNLYSADAVIGNKRHLYSSANYGALRSFVSKSLNFIVKILFNINFADTQCGIKLFKKSFLDRVIGKVSNKRYVFDIELILAMRAIGARIADAPVTIKKQINSGSVNIKNIFLTFFDVIYIFLRWKNGAYL